MVHPTLAGRRVLELGGYVASPFSTNMLAHLGAEIIKIESADGDPTRKMVRGGPGGPFIAYSAGKKSICIDLRSAAGHEVFERLLATADIVVHNLAPESARRLKVTYEDCVKIRPQVVHCHIRGYGPGPLENAIASNPIIEASTGAMFANQVNGRPTRFGPPYLDMFAGMYAVIGILGAIAADTVHEKSHRIEVGLFETGMFINAREYAGAQLHERHKPGSSRSAAGEFAKPGYGTYKTLDERWIYLLLLSDNHWARFCKIMELPEANDTSLKTMYDRRQQRARVEKVVSTTVAGLSYEQVTKKLDAANVGYTEVTPFDKVLEQPQASQPGKTRTSLFQGQEFTLPNFPVMSEYVSPGLDTPAPELGQHTVDLVKSLGYSDAQCEALLASGAVTALGVAPAQT